MNLFEVQAKVAFEKENGDLKVEKTSVIIEAMTDTFTEVEAIALKYFPSITTYNDKTIIEKITKINYRDIITNEKLTLDLIDLKMLTYTPTERDCNFWKVTNEFIVDLDKNKKQKEAYLIPANSAAEATNEVGRYLSDLGDDNKIIKTELTKMYSIILKDKNND